MLLQFRGHALKQIRGSINRHQVKAYIGLAHAHAAEKKPVFVLHNIVGIEVVVSFRIMDHDQFADVGFENLSQLEKRLGKIISFRHRFRLSQIGLT